MTLIFVYGTLMKEKTREMVLGHNVPAESDVLDDFEVVPHSVFLIYPTIQKAKGKGTDGYVFEVEEDEIPRLDMYESGLYKKIEVVLQSGTVALTYIENNDLSE